MAEITREEAIKVIQTEKECVNRASHCLRNCQECELVMPEEVILNAYDKAISALENADKYRWHDLRKNPEDLPGEDCEDDFFTVATDGIDENGTECRGFVQTAEYNYDGTWGDVSIFQTVVAWRYIEPFESEVSDERKEENA